MNAIALTTGPQRSVSVVSIAVSSFMLQSGSRGVGNAIGTMFIELAKRDALRAAGASLRLRRLRHP